MFEPQRSASACWLRPRFNRTLRSSRPNVSASGRTTATQLHSLLTYSFSSIILSQYIERRSVMDKLTRISIRRIFLTPRPNVEYLTAADRLGISFLELKSEIAEGTNVAV